jgi:hypothetical protein
VIVSEIADAGDAPPALHPYGTITLDMRDLAGEMRERLAVLWQERAESESAVRTVFHQLADELAATGGHPDVVTLARRSAADEIRHAAVCSELATAYRGSHVAPPSPPAVRLPDYTTDRRLRAALHAVNLCCIGETLAVAFVEACLADCADGTLREIHSRHLADEVRHARVGWAQLASLSESERAAVAVWIPELLRQQIAAWESRIGDLPEAGVPGHAYPPRAQLIEAIRVAVRELVLPGFAYVGITVEISSDHVP